MYTPSVTVDNVIKALADFLQPFVQDDNGEVVRAQVNRVAMPPNPCIILTELLEVDIEVPYENYDALTLDTKIKGPTRIDVQIDFYGAKAGDYCKAVKNAFRSQWGFAQFPDSVKPLYTSDGIQSPLITGEEQYESRWTLTASMQYNPVVTVPQDSANALDVVVKVPVDLT